MAIGTRKYLVAIKTPPTGQDALGQPSGVWTSVCAPWADIRYLRGFEAIKAGKVTSTKTCSIRIGYRENITEGMRVYHAGVVYNITAVLPDLLKKEHVDLVCEVM